MCSVRTEINIFPIFAPNNQKNSKMKKNPFGNRCGVSRFCRVGAGGAAGLLVDGGQQRKRDNKCVPRHNKRLPAGFQNL